MHSAEHPEAGYYRMRLVMGGPLVGIRLWYGPPLDPTVYDPADPETHQPLDRSYRWNALANGEIVDFDRVWPRCISDPIKQSEYEYLTQRTLYAKAHDPSDPTANTRRRTDWDASSVPSL